MVNGAGPFYHIQGIIDDVRIYDRALSSEEIEEVFREGIGSNSFAPNPADGAVNVDPNAVLSWSPGKDAFSHDVYFGTDFDDVNDADTTDPNVFMGNQDFNSWDPCGLGFETTYYWRIDEVGGEETCKGDVWSFTTWASEPDPNLFGWWRFDEGEGDIAYDSAGNRHGTVYGAQWTNGQIGGALNFDGFDDYVGLPDNDPVWLPEYNFTISTWAYFNRDPGSSHEVLLDLNCGASTDSANRLGYMVQTTIAGAGKLSFGMYTISSAESLLTDYVLAKERWYHIVALRNGTTQSIYIDGQLDVSKTCSPDPIDFVGGYDDNRINIGRYTVNVGSPAYHFQGIIDDVRIYDRALSGEEVWQLYQGGLN